MVAGRDLDALVAEKVMGLTIKRKQVGIFYEGNNGLWPIVPSYSTDIAAAWQVMETMKQREWDVMVRWSEAVRNNGRNYHKWLCWVAIDERTGYGAAVDTAPHAICLAALKAMGVHVEETV